MKQAWLSDLHVGVKGHPSDEFGGIDREKKLYKMLGNLDSETDLIGLNGDIFELWGFSWEEIKESRPVVLEAINKYVDIFLKGNHDKELPDKVAGIPVSTKYTTENKELLVLHGHQFDFLNHGDWGFIGEFFGTLGSYIEAYVYRDIDNVWYGLQQLVNDGRYGQNDAYFKDIKEERSYYDNVIIGHTHDVSISTDQPYKPIVFNTGTWVGGRQDALIIDYAKSNVEVTLH